MSQARLSAIMVSWRTGPVLFDAVAAVLADPDIAELVLVDHDNPAADRARLDAWAQDEARLVIKRTNANLGFGRGCNLGAAAARGDILFFINPDARPETGCAARLAARLDGEPETAIAGARILGPDGREQSGARRRRLTVWRALASFTGLARLGWAQPFGMENEPLPNAPIEVAAVSGAAFAIRASGFAALGGFDEGYFLHVEDIDLCRRAARVWFVPDAVVHHVGGSSDAGPVVIAWEKAKSFLRYFWKFGTGPGRVAIVLAAPALVMAILARGLWRRLRRA